MKQQQSLDRFPICRSPFRSPFPLTMQHFTSSGTPLNPLLLHPLPPSLAMPSMISTWIHSSKFSGLLLHLTSLTSPPLTLPPVAFMTTSIMPPLGYSADTKPLIPVVSAGGTLIVISLSPAFIPPLVLPRKPLSKTYAKSLLPLNVNGHTTSFTTPPPKIFGKLWHGTKVVQLNTSPHSLLPLFTCLMTSAK